MISAALQLLMRFGPDIAKVGYNYVNPKLGAVPKVRADAVDILNGLRAGSREAWTQESLFLFCAAFIRPDADDTDGWVRPKAEVVALLTRGVHESHLPEDAMRIIGLAMDEVRDMTRLMPPISVEARPKPENKTVQEMGALRVGMMLLGNIIFPEVALATSLITRVRDDRLHIILLRAIAQSLTQGGLSTIECKTVLLDQGLPEKVVLKALELS